MNSNERRISLGWKRNSMWTSRICWSPRLIVSIRAIMVLLIINSPYFFVTSTYDRSFLENITVKMTSRNVGYIPNRIDSDTIVSFSFEEQKQTIDFEHTFVVEVQKKRMSLTFRFEDKRYSIMNDFFLSIYDVWMKSIYLAMFISIN